MGNLALSFSDIGRHDDALELLEKVLEFRLRVLPKDHPDIGDRTRSPSNMHLQCSSFDRRRSHEQYRKHTR
jgi:hypothetical protein